MYAWHFVKNYIMTQKVSHHTLQPLVSNSWHSKGSSYFQIVQNDLSPLSEHELHTSSMIHATAFLNNLFCNNVDCNNHFDVWWWTKSFLFIVMNK
jgi:hypothetical protein